MAQTNRNGNLSLFKLNCIQISNESYYRQRKEKNCLKFRFFWKKRKNQKSSISIISGNLVGLYFYAALKQSNQTPVKCLVTLVSIVC
jgi:hypothetical protein